MAGFDAWVLAEFAALLIVAGAFAGFLAGLFGIGGGTVLVPAFYQVFQSIGIDEAIRMQLAVGCSLALVIVSSWRSIGSHRKKGAVDEDLLRSWWVPLPVGAILASIAVAYVSGDVLKGVFAVVCALIAFKMLFGRDGWKLGTEIPGNPVRGIVGAAIGFLSTLMGIGGGVLNNTFMTAYGRPIHQAVATSAGVGMFIAIPGMLGYIWAGWGKAGLPPFSTGYVNWIAVALILPVTLLVTPWGVKLAHALPKRKLEVALGVYLLFVAVRFGWALVA